MLDDRLSHPLIPTLHRATEQDVDWLLPLAERLFCEAFEAYYRPEHFWGYVDRAFTEAVWRAELRDAQSEFQAIWWNGQPQGYLKLNWDPAHQPACLPTRNALEVARLYLDARQHGSGYAQRMMEHALARAKHQRRSGVWLGVWQRNHRAMSFYQKNYFQIIGTHPFEMGAGLIEDDFVMFREL
jgi:diamine N-acetyltransferase